MESIPPLAKWILIKSKRNINIYGENDWIKFEFVIKKRPISHNGVRKVGTTPNSFDLFVLKHSPITSCVMLCTNKQTGRQTYANKNITSVQTLLAEVIILTLSTVLVIDIAVYGAQSLPRASAHNREARTDWHLLTTISMFWFSDAFFINIWYLLRENNTMYWFSYTQNVRIHYILVETNPKKKKNKN